MDREDESRSVLFFCGSTGVCKPYPGRNIVVEESEVEIPFSLFDALQA